MLFGVLYFDRRHQQPWLERLGAGLRGKLPFPLEVSASCFQRNMEAALFIRFATLQSRSIGGGIIVEPSMVPGAAVFEFRFFGKGMVL